MIMIISPFHIIIKDLVYPRRNFSTVSIHSCYSLRSIEVKY